VHGMTAVREVSAHLELLIAQSLVRSDESGPTNPYVAA
jgi:hypothetical protein